MTRLSYANWPRWVKIVHACTFPVSEPVRLGLMQVGKASGISMIVFWIVQLKRHNRTETQRLSTKKEKDDGE